MTVKRNMIDSTIDMIWDTYDCDGDDKLSSEEAHCFIKDSLNVLILKDKAGAPEGEDDIDLDLLDAKQSLDEDYWRLFTLFDAEFKSKEPDEHDEEYTGCVTKEDMKHFLTYLLEDEHEQGVLEEL